MINSASPVGTVVTETKYANRSCCNHLPLRFLGKKVENLTANLTLSFNEIQL